MLSIRPFQDVIKEASWVFSFLRNRLALLLSFMLGPAPGMVSPWKPEWNPIFELNIWDKGLMQGQSSWSQGSEQMFALHPPPATLPWVSFLSPTVSYHCPSPTSSAPVYTILKGSTQQTGSLHNCYLNT